MTNICYHIHERIFLICKLLTAAYKGILIPIPILTLILILILIPILILILLLLIIKTITKIIIIIIMILIIITAQNKRIVVTQGHIKGKADIKKVGLVKGKGIKIEKGNKRLSIANITKGEVCKKFTDSASLFSL